MLLFNISVTVTNYLPAMVWSVACYKGDETAATAIKSYSYCVLQQFVLAILLDDVRPLQNISQGMDRK